MKVEMMYEEYFMRSATAPETIVALVEQNIASKNKKLHKSKEIFLVPPEKKCVEPISPPFERPNIKPKPKSQYMNTDIQISVRFFMATLILFFSRVSPDSTI